MSPMAVNAHALLTTAWQALARGGETAPQVRKRSPEAGPTRADLSFQETKAGARYEGLWLRPLKKKRGRCEPKDPQYIAECDGGGSDANEALRRLVKYDPVGSSVADVTPLFRGFSASGGHKLFTVAAMRSLIRQRMRGIGCTEAADWESHSCRIGGETDLVETGGNRRRRNFTQRAVGRVIYDVSTRG